MPNPHESQKPYTKRGKANWQAVFGPKCTLGCGDTVDVKGDVCTKCLIETYESMSVGMLVEPESK
jgi:hypothetical protein